MDAGVLMTTAASIAIAHTALGPDHYVPFAALSAARGWSTRRTLIIAALCGLGHVAASVALAFVAVGLGSALLDMAGITAIRADVAAWLMIGFGVAYAIYGAKRLTVARHRHEHAHVHADGTQHTHSHTHRSEHLHPHSLAHERVGSRSGLAWAWGLFVVFLFGPCEPLIPLVMAPASQGAWVAVASVVAAFALATVCTMLVIVGLLCCGITQFAIGRNLGQWAHTAAGSTVALCGVAMIMGL